MGSFFRGWRRKTGLVALALALLVLGDWMRANQIRFMVPDHTRRTLDIFQTGHDGVVWQRLSGIDPEPWRLLLELSGSVFPLQSMDLDVIRERTEWGFGLGEAWRSPGRERQMWQCRIPQWTIVLPLTLVAAWLLLSQRSLPLAPDETERTTRSQSRND